MNWFEYLASIPELGSRVFYPKYPEHELDGAFVHASYDPDGSAGVAAVGAGSGVRVVNLEFGLPANYTQRKGQEQADPIALRYIAQRVWLEAPLMITNDLTDNLAVLGSVQTSTPFEFFDPKTQRHSITMELRFAVFANYRVF
jgi:hypothetical protein